MTTSTPQDVWQTDVNAHHTLMFVALAGKYGLNDRLTPEGQFADPDTHLADVVAHKAASLLSSAARVSHTPRPNVVPGGWTQEQSIALADTAFLVGKVARTQGLDAEMCSNAVSRYIYSQLPQGRQAGKETDFTNSDFPKLRSQGTGGRGSTDLISGKTIMEMVEIRRMLGVDTVKSR